jgi:hypothetical protein
MPVDTEERVKGVALIVQNGDDIMIIEEFFDKPSLKKKRGDGSAPMETVRRGESDLEALRRMEEEELPGIPRLPLPGEFIGQYEVVEGTWANLYRVKTISRQLPAQAGDAPEVGNYRWMPPSIALTLVLRPGAREMIEDHVAGHTNVRRAGCRPPSDRI